MNLRYSHLKAFKFPDRIAALWDGTTPAPVHVYLILSDLCNQNCGFCAFRDPSSRMSELFHVGDDYNPNRMLPFEKIVEVLDDCAEMGVRAIEFTGGGEPTAHPRFQDAVTAVLDRGMRWGIVTNGVKQGNDFSTASWMRVSLDAGTEETYCKVRRVPSQHFRAACSTIKKWRCPVSFVVTPENWSEIVLATDLAKSLGASSIRIRAQTNESGLDLFSGIRERVLPLVEIARRFAGPDFEIIDQFESDLSEEKVGRQDYQFCGRQFFSPWIGADQNLYRCCLYAYHPRGLVASIKGRRFRDVWEEVQADLRAFDARGCDKCRFAPMNRAINESLATDPNEAFV